MKYLIIGNGVAAIGAVEGIRTVDKEGQIVIVSAEPFVTYGRPLIANLLSGRIQESEMLYRPESFYSENKVELILGKEVRSVNAASHTVFLEDGSRLPFEKLLIATGGKPFIPPIQGKDGPDVYTFTTLQDARKMEGLIGKAEEVTVIGGGLIGLKAAESLHDRGIKITVIELADRILSAAFDLTAGSIIGLRLQRVGINIITGTSAKEIIRDSNGRVKGILLNDGREIPCQAVVVAIGVIPDKDIVEGTEIKSNRGILVDDHMETSVRDIYAAGDVAEALDLLSGERKVVPIWPNAYVQGNCAGRNMAGAAVSYQGGLPMNSIEFYGIPTISVGVANPSPEMNCEILTRLVPEDNIYKKFVIKDNVLIGVVLVGKVDRAGIYTGLIRNRIDVSEFKDSLLSDDFGLVFLPKEARKKMMAV